MCVRSSLLDQTFDALAHLPRWTLKPSREVHVVLRLELLHFRLEERELTVDVVGLGHGESIVTGSRLWHL